MTDETENPTPIINHKAVLTAAVNGCYDLQKLRIQTGLRLVSSFRSKLKINPEIPQEPRTDDELTPEAESKLTPEAESILKQLKQDYKLVTTGIARNRTLPTRQGFTGQGIINDYTELVLIDSYLMLEREEAKQFRLLEYVVEGFPIYDQWLKHQHAIGPAMAAVLISRIDINKCPRVSSLWRYTGLDVAPDGFGRSKRHEHLIEKRYIAKDRTEKTKLSITYDEWLRSKLLGTLATVMLKLNSPWRQAYDFYKHRLQTDPTRMKVTSKQYTDAYKVGGREAVRQMWTPKRIHSAAMRYMIKMFLAELWGQWRQLEGLPVLPTYEEARRNYAHGADPSQQLNQEWRQHNASLVGQMPLQNKPWEGFQRPARTT